MPLEAPRGARSAHRRLERLDASLGCRRKDHGGPTPHIRLLSWQAAQDIPLMARGDWLAGVGGWIDDSDLSTIVFYDSAKKGIILY